MTLSSEARGEKEKYYFKNLPNESIENIQFSQSELDLPQLTQQSPGNSNQSALGLAPTESSESDRGFNTIMALKN